MEFDSKKPVKILFVTFVPFPYGLAQTNRLIAIARGLTYSGGVVKVICLKPTASPSSKKVNPTGVFEGIEYAYPGGTTVRSRNPLIRIFHYLSGFINTNFYIIRENRRLKTDFICIGIVPFFMYTWFYLLSSILRIKYIQERSEYPFIKAKKSIFDPLSLKVYLNLVCKYFDGFLVITHELKKYFSPHLGKDCPVFLLPILVESDRFALKPVTSDVKYIAYCGSMQGDKDGVPDLIEAYNIFRNSHPEIKLYLIGSTQFPEFEELKQKISGLKLEEDIIFTGVIGRDELPSILAGAMILVLARPENAQAKGGFPTKLGEYLSTGKPVLVTDVGEITDYLTDCIHAFIAPPGNPEAFAQKMTYIIDQYDQALNVGLQGQQLAHSTFNYKFQGKLLMNWLKEIING